MRFFLFLTLAVFVFVAPVAARAAGDEIRIVQPDGSVVVVKIPVAEPPKPPPVPSPQEVKAQQQEEPQAKPSDNNVPYAQQRSPEDGEKSAPAPAKKKPKKHENYSSKAESIGRIKREPEPAPAIAPGTEITKDMAVSIALEHAPPAGSISVLPRTHKDRQVYVVTFKTEDGDLDILVDKQTGEIVPP